MVNPSNPDIPVAAIQQASSRPEIVEAMGQLYADADRRIAEHHPTCWNKGECCRFGRFGHRLYVTSLEAAYYLATGEQPPPVTEDTCPHAHDGQCHARQRRPLGCRIFHCDLKAQQWQGPLTEEFLARLGALHDRFSTPYIYADWMAILRTLSLSADR